MEFASWEIWKKPSISGIQRFRVLERLLFFCGEATFDLLDIFSGLPLSVER